MNFRTKTVFLYLIVWCLSDVLNTSSKESSECESGHLEPVTCYSNKSEVFCTDNGECYQSVEVNVCNKDPTDVKQIIKIFKMCSSSCAELWSEWSNLGGCSVTCGEGKQYRTRNRFLPCAQIDETAIEENVCDQTKCPVFRWDHLNSRNLTFEEKKEMMKDELVEIKANLTVDKKNTSAAIRRRTSAPDHRPSATSFGYFGIILLVLPLVLIVCTDCTRCCQSKEKFSSKRICQSKRETGVELTVMELDT